MDYKKLKSFYIDFFLDKALAVFQYGGGNPTFFKQFEKNLLIEGKCAVIKRNGQLYATSFSPYIWTYYEDIPYVGSCEMRDFVKKYGVLNFLHIGTPEKVNIGQLPGCVLVYSDKTQNGISRLIEQCSELMTHCDITLKNMLITSREGGNTYCVGADKLRHTIESYYRNLALGKLAPITDLGLETVKTVENKKSVNGAFSEIAEIKRGVIEFFYNCMGVRTAHEKKGNMIEEEIYSNDNMLLCNIANMLECRQTGLKEINKWFGENLTVQIRGDFIDL